MLACLYRVVQNLSPTPMDCTSVVSSMVSLLKHEQHVNESGQPSKSQLTSNHTAHSLVAAGAVPCTWMMGAFTQPPHFCLAAYTPEHSCLSVHLLHRKGNHFRHRVSRHPQRFSIPVALYLPPPDLQRPLAADLEAGLEGTYLDPSSGSRRKRGSC